MFSLRAKVFQKGCQNCILFAQEKFLRIFFVYWKLCTFLLTSGNWAEHFCWFRLEKFRLGCWNWILCDRLNIRNFSFENFFEMRKSFLNFPDIPALFLRKRISQTLLTQILVRLSSSIQPFAYNSTKYPSTSADLPALFSLVKLDWSNFFVSSTKYCHLFNNVKAALE